MLGIRFSLIKIINYFLLKISAIRTVGTFTEYPTFISSCKTIAILFIAFSLLASTPFCVFRHVFYQKGKTILSLKPVFRKSLWVSAKSLNYGCLVFMAMGVIFAITAITVLITEYLKKKTFTVHF